MAVRRFGTVLAAGPAEHPDHPFDPDGQRPGGRARSPAFDGGPALQQVQKCRRVRRCPGFPLLLILVDRAVDPRTFL
jgi:hypothetical protein